MTRFLGLVRRSAPWALLGVAAAGVLVGYVVFVLRAPDVLLPPDAVPRSGSVPSPMTRAEQVTAVHNARLLAVSFGGALVVLVGLLYTARNYRLAHRGQVTDRFTKALERLGSAELYVRIGGVHALEHVLRDSADHHADIVEVLVAFVRTRAFRAVNEHEPEVAAESAEPPWPDADVQAALTALAHRARRPRRERNRIDLTDLHLQGVSLPRAQLQGAKLDRAELASADLSGANLERASLSGTRMPYAKLSGARLQGADLQGATLQRAGLSRAQVQGASFGHARLQRAVMSRANLRQAALFGAKLQEADLSGAQLQGADLRDADLQSADLSNAQLQGADLRGANLQAANLRGANLRETNLSGARLQAADLSAAQMKGANLRQANLGELDGQWPTTVTPEQIALTVTDEPSGEGATDA